MRTTIDLDDDLLRTAKTLAAARKVTLSRVVSDLARKGLQPEPVKYKYRNGFPVYPALPGDSPITPEMIDEMLDQADREDAGL